MNLIALNIFLKKNSLPKFREAQIKRAFFKELAESWDEVRVLPKVLRDSLSQELKWDSLEMTGMTDEAKEETSKAAFKLIDGAIIESVLIRHKDGRNTVCVSSQAGCPLGCSFCATGNLGFKRNLIIDEIVEQVIFFARKLKKENLKVSNVVFMGMGEPFLNYDNVIGAVKVLNDAELFGLGARHISISTIGIVPAIKKFAAEPYQTNLAFSLHAPREALRTSIIPANRQNKLKDVMLALEFYVSKTNRRVMIEYLLINGVNDSEREARELASLLKDKKLFYVNLIKYHQTGKYASSQDNSIRRFIKVLNENKIQATIRHSFGESIWAACGQLAGKND